MDALLLCAGFGTRLRPLTKHTPKVLLEVAGRPMLDYLMDQLVALDGLEAVHIVANGRHFGPFYNWQQRWKKQLEDGPTLHLHCDGVLEEEERLGAVGDLAWLLRRADTSEGALVAAGDSIYRFALQPLYERFRQEGDSLVLALHQPNAQRLKEQSVLELKDDRVRHVVDAPGEPPSRWVCPALYFLTPSTLDRVDAYLEAGKDRDTLGTLIDYLARHEPVRAVRLPEREELRFTDMNLRFHINARYQCDKANEILAEEPLMIEEKDGGVEG